MVLPIDDLLAAVGGAFHAAGRQLYLVGGAVRDELLGRPVQDLDFATDAPPEVSADILQSIAGATVFRVGERFGTIGVAIESTTAEITTYRSAESYPAGSRKPDVQFGTSIDEDLSRRDFTVNAMARSAVPGGSPDIVDPFGGQADLNRRCIRAVGDAEARFREDPLRLLRGVRFAALLDFDLDSDTWAALTAHPELLLSVSRERVAAEVNAMLLGPAPTRGFTLLRDSGIMAVLLPELTALDQLPDQGPNHQYSLWDHTFRVVEATPPDLVTRWAALLHDIAKPETMTEEPDGRLRFFGHDDAGAAKAEVVLRSLRLSNETVASVTRLVETHMKLHQYRPEWSDGAVRRLVLKLDEDFSRAVDLAAADAAGHGDSPWSYSGAAALADRAEHIMEGISASKSPLSGEDLMARYHRPPGPWIRTINSALMDAILDGRLVPTDVEDALSIADAVEATIPRP